MSFFEAVDAGSFVSGILWNDVMFDEGLLLLVIVRQKKWLVVLIIIWYLKMDRLLTLDQIRVICVSLFSSTLAYLTPTQGFLVALAVMFAFNIWCGMRADGVSIIRCKNFKWSKFKNALAELLLYLVIIEVVFVFMDSIGDGESALIVIKTITYVFSYVYLQNAFKNLITAYPKNKAFRIIYHLIRFEFKRAMPSHVQEVIGRIENEIDKEEEK